MMNYQLAAEICLAVGIALALVTVLLIFILDVPALLDEMRGRPRRRVRKEPKEPARLKADESDSTDVETVLLKGTETVRLGSEENNRFGEEGK